MGPIDFFWHLSNLFAVSLLFGAVCAGGAKLIWRQRLAAVPWFRLAASVAGASSVTTVAGLLAFGRDGRMATLGLVVLAGAAALAWVGFRRRA
jgi:hypothetical protein